MAKIEGIDVSHWNSADAITDYKPQFAMIKLTEGLTFVDDFASTHRQNAKTMGIPYGYYHYARAERNAPMDEARHFVRHIPHDDLNHAVLALDFEGKGLSIKDVDEWAETFCKEVEILTGKKPLLYCSQSVVKRFPKTCAGGFGLWVARYRNKLLGAGDIKPWKFCAIWQYTSKGIDRNIFYGTVRQFRKYGEV